MTQITLDRHQIIILASKPNNEDLTINMMKTIIMKTILSCKRNNKKSHMVKLLTIRINIIKKNNQMIIKMNCLADSKLTLIVINTKIIQN